MTARIRILCGTINGIQGPVKDIIIDPEYLDISVPAGSEYIHPTRKGYTAFLYVIGGKGFTGAKNETLLENETIVLFDDGDQVRIATEEEPVRILFLSGKPIGEPVAWGDPL